MAETKTAAKTATNPNDPNRRVNIKLFRDNGKYKDPVFVRVNDYTCYIPRGVTVSIPYFVAKHVQEMLDQDESTATLIEELVQDFQRKEKEMAG